MGGSQCQVLLVLTFCSIDFFGMAGVVNLPPLLLSLRP